MTEYIASKREKKVQYLNTNHSLRLGIAGPPGVMNSNWTTLFKQFYWHLLPLFFLSYWKHFLKFLTEISSFFHTIFHLRCIIVQMNEIRCFSWFCLMILVENAIKAKKMPCQLHCIVSVMTRFFHHYSRTDCEMNCTSINIIYDNWGVRIITVRIFLRISVSITVDNSRHAVAVLYTISPLLMIYFLN